LGTRRGFSPEVSDAYAKTLAGLGEPQRVSFFGTEEPGDDVVHRCEFAFAAKTLTAQPGVTADDKISAFGITLKP